MTETDERPKWRYTVEGTAMSHGTVQRPYEESGAYVAETSGEVLEWMVHGPESPVYGWDLDTQQRFTVTIEPATEGT